MFHKQEWDQHLISGYTPGEIRVLMGLKHHIEPDGPGMKVSEISKDDECYVTDDHPIY